MKRKENFVEIAIRELVRAFAGAEGAVLRTGCPLSNRPGIFTHTPSVSLGGREEGVVFSRTQGRLGQVVFAVGR